MKSRICRGWSLGLAVLILSLGGGCLPQAASSPETAAVAAEPDRAPELAVAQAVEDPVVQTQTDPAEAEIVPEVSDAPATPVSDDIAVPANLRPTPAVAEMIKLANSGVEESVMLSVATNSTGTFNLRPEEIIYLTDIGVPATVVTAMLQHDHLLQARETYVTDLSLVPPAAPVITDQYAPEPALATAPDQAVPSEPTEAMPQYAPITYPLPEAASAPAEPESAPDFYDSLTPYGTWVDVAGYGRCWQPTTVVVNPAWQPYCDHGHWVYSNCGWYWMSDYSWGWAPFHYGRWFQHHRLGWCWEPDHVWGPSWVCWRYSQNYCGWAPLPPSACFDPGIGMTFHGHRVRSDCSFGLAAQHFHFVATDHFTDRHVDRRVVSRDQATKIFDSTVASTSTTLRNDTIVIRGIPKERIAATSHKPVPQVALHPNPTALPLPSGQPFSDKVLRRPATELNRAVAQQARMKANAPANAGVGSLPQLHSSALPQKPLAVASYGMGTAPSPQTHPGSQIDPPANGKQVPSEATTVVAQPRPGRTGPLILRGPSRPQQDRPATVVHPGKEAGNSSLVVIGSRHPAPAAGFSHSTPQPVHLPSAQAPSQPFGMPSDKIGGLAENEPSARFHQAFSLPKPSVNATPSAPQQSAPWWIARPSSSSPNRVEPTFSPAQPVVADHVSHPAAVHHSPAASQPSAPASHAESHAAPSAPAASHHSQSSATKGSR